MVSFSPNIVNEESLELAKNTKILLNNRGESHNCHLLEFVSLGDKRYTGKNICDIFITILQGHNLVDKLGTITMDNATNNENFHNNLVYDYFNKITPAGHQMLTKVRFISCPNHVLNLIFQRIIKEFHGYLIFADAFKKISKLAKIMRYSTATNASLKKHNIPLIPYGAPNRWVYTWRQVSVFLEIYVAYTKWSKTPGGGDSNHVVARFQPLLTFDEKTIQLLTYFVQCCIIYRLIEFHISG